MVKQVGIFYHPLIQAAVATAKEMEEFLAIRGISVWTCSAWESEAAMGHMKGTDLVLSVGGDGTILRTAHAIMPESIPITGINLGRLGFLSELSAAEAKEKLPLLLSGQGWIDERSMLEAELVPAGQATVSSPFYALNDVVVARGAIARLISIEASIDSEILTTYRADGVIVATATGSTGYALVAGGPILHPQAADTVLMPILPHLSLPYSMVLPPSATIRLVVSTTHQATLSVDGHINLPLANGAVIIVRRSARTARFLRIRPRNMFYSSLEQRLKGRNDPGRKG
ncbi:MAG: NAD(+)/NADH kinase [Chloroflexi bacterium]|nr:NAD(+)/NADH kinase [Chloroflexota bacterium]